MSLVGPRPCLASQKTLVAERELRAVFSVQPGMTGLGQVNQVDMSAPTHLANLDAQYVQNASIFMDAMIVLSTFTGKPLWAEHQSEAAQSGVTAEA